MTVIHSIEKLVRPAVGNMLDDLPTYHDKELKTINFICEMPQETF